MVYLNSRQSKKGLTSMCVAWFAVVLMASTAVPALAGSSGTWTSTGNLNVARTGHTATLLPNGEVLVAGGEDVNGNILASAELYSPTTGKWTMTGSMATPRVSHAATLLHNGEVLVAGGYNSHTTDTATAELYNPATGQWTSTGGMTEPRSLPSAVLLANGKVVVASGVTDESAEIYDPSKATWKATGSMDSYHLFTLVALLNGQVLAVDESGTTGAPGELYDPSAGKWSLTAGTYYSHTGVSTAMLPSGDILVYGNKFSCYAAEFYNPSANTWTHTTGQCGNAISSGAMERLGTGKVLLVGNTIVYSGKAYSTTHCALYDPSANSWTLTGSLLQAAHHSATLLLNGQVLAVGGSDAELYTP
jgi:large repetitive protein